MPFTASTLQIGGYHSYQHRSTNTAITATNTTKDIYKILFE